MAKVTIGLDIGTTAVRAAELRGKDEPTLVRFAQLSLPAGAMNAGEIVEPDAVAEVIRDLWRRGEFKAKQVAVAVENQNVIARQVELPTMPEEELRGALQFQVQDYMPIAAEDAVLDFLILEEFTGEDNAPMMRVLAVAAQRQMVNATLDVVQGAGLDVVSVDMAPLAALRAVIDPEPIVIDEEPGAEAIVDIGGGVTTVMVHERGVPRFARVLPAGGGDITAALVSELGIDAEDAEAQKLSTSLQPEGSTVEPGVPTIIEQRARAFIDDVRRSVEYYQSQAGAAKVGRVLLTGGGARLRRLPERLATALRLPVEEADAFARITVGDLGLSDEQLEQVRAVGAIAIGLALEGS